jgi:pyridoxamine 5'-phosphate oxidase
MSDPIERFRRWFAEVLDGGGPLAGACCLSTVGLDGYPNARFVALKGVDEAGFIVTGPLRSRKGGELARLPRAALTFWWPERGRQVRIQGDASALDAALADDHFAARPRDAQLLAWASRQGEPLGDEQEFRQRLEGLTARFAGRPIPRPPDWGGYRIVPCRCEFLRFREDRLHQRDAYERAGDGWRRTTLQP